MFSPNSPGLRGGRRVGVVSFGRFAGEGVEELGGEEVDLGAVEGDGVFADEVAVADSGAAVGVVLDAEVGEELDGGLAELREGVGGTRVDGEDGGDRRVGGALLPVLQVSRCSKGVT